MGLAIQSLQADCQASLRPLFVSQGALKRRLSGQDPGQTGSNYFLVLNMNVRRTESLGANKADAPATKNKPRPVHPTVYYGMRPAQKEPRSRLTATGSIFASSTAAMRH